MTLKVLISDPLGQEGLDILDATPGVEAIVETGLKGEDLRKKLNEVDAVIIRSGTTLSADVLEGNTRLKAIGRAGIGVDNIDLDAATRLGIVVMNTPSGNAITTAEHAISLMMSAARHIPQACAKLRAGIWDRKMVGTELYGKTLGIIGLGNIGSLVVERAQGLGMNVVGFDPFVTEDRAQALGVELASVEEVIERADVLTLHVPLTDKTRHLIGAEQLRRMKPTAILVNAARGGIVDEAALADALEAGEIAAAALDVFEQEPPDPENPLLKSERCIFTPHLGASTREAQTKVAVDVVKQVCDFLLKGEIRNAVNAASVSADVLERLGPWLTLSQQLAALLGQLHDGAFERIRINFAGEISAQETRPLIARAVAAILRTGIEELVNEVNALEVAKQRGIHVEATRTAETRDYASSVTITIEGPERATSGTGTVFGQNEPRIVRINDFRMEPLAIHGALLFAVNRDVPGVIGRLGTLLGEAGVNIAQMSVGRTPEREGMALTVVALDGPASDETLAAMRDLDVICELRQVLL
ncbi:MAG: phosphoglycerate dehydrogenase [Candidatus Dadabacteria bacterium]|nr:MAG: phosphoglycerate dehydrogenase [Candidatus Dadabacteria bacterium]